MPSTPGRRDRDTVIDCLGIGRTQGWTLEPSAATSHTSHHDSLPGAPLTTRLSADAIDPYRDHFPRTAAFYGSRPGAPQKADRRRAVDVCRAGVRSSLGEICHDIRCHHETTGIPGFVTHAHTCADTRGA